MFPVRMSPGSASQQSKPLSWRRASARLMQGLSWTAASPSSCAPQAATWLRVVARMSERVFWPTRTSGHSMFIMRAMCATPVELALSACTTSTTDARLAAID